MVDFPRLKELMTKEGMDEMFQACWFECEKPITDHQIESALSETPWLPESYIDFLKTTNGCVLHMDVFYGHGGECRSQANDQQFYTDGYDKGNWFAIGHTGAGDAVLINREGNISLVGSDPPPDVPEIRFSSIHEFIESFVCGERYLEYANNYDGNDWCGFLKKKGWLK